MERGVGGTAVDVEDDGLAECLQVGIGITVWGVFPEKRRPPKFSIEKNLAKTLAKPCELRDPPAYNFFFGRAPPFSSPSTLGAPPLRPPPFLPCTDWLAVNRFSIRFPFAAIRPSLP